MTQTVEDLKQELQDLKHEYLRNLVETSYIGFYWDNNRITKIGVDLDDSDIAKRIRKLGRIIQENFVTGEDITMLALRYQSE